jgi:hypothetical protein
MFNQFGGYEMNRQTKIVFLVVSFFLIGTLFYQSVSNTYIVEHDIEIEAQFDRIEDNEGVTISKIDRPDFPLSPESEEFLAEDPSSKETQRDSTHGNTRSSVRESPDYANGHTNANEYTAPTTIDGDLPDESDQDWFKIRLKGDDGSGSQVDNVSVTVTDLQDSNYYRWDTFQVFIFGIYDYGTPSDDDQLVIMDAEGYRPHTSLYQSQWEVCFAKAFATGYYYIMVKSSYDYPWGNQGGPISYTFNIAVESTTPEDRNQVAESGDTLTNKKAYKVDSQKDIFDWYKVNSPTGKNYPINLSFKFNIENSAGAYTDKDHFGKNIHFVCEVIVLVFHDINKAPVATLKGSSSNLFGMNSTIQYTENTTAKVSYIGVYVQMFGVDDQGEGPYYFVEYAPNNDRHHGGYASYSFDLIVDWIIKPMLVDERVTPYHGRTYDTYVYRVLYKDENNQPPIIHQIRVNNRPIVDMTLVGFNGSKDYYKDGAFYEYSIDGVKLGEGSHFFMFNFRDPDGSAERSGMKFGGPYITDNIPPQIRVIADDSIDLYEDCGSQYIELNEIFDDVDNDDMTFTVQQGSDWVTYLETEIATYSIRSNETFRITPSPNAYGKDILYLNATDSNKEWIKIPFKYTINIIPVNDPPQIKKYLGERRINEDSKLTGIDLNDYFYDPIEPEQTLEFGFEPVDKVDVVVDALGENVIITPEDDWYGEVSIRFAASDGYDTIYNVLRLNVIPVNDPPVFKNPRGFTINESEWFHLKLTAYDPIENDEVSIETNLTGEVNNKLMQAGRIVTPSRGGVVPGKNMLIEKDSKDDTITIFSFNATNEMAGGGSSSYSGLYYINFTAVDAGGARVNHNVIMTVMNKNDPPAPKINRPLNASTFYNDELIYFFGDAGDPDSIHGGINFYTWSSNLHGEIGKKKYPDPIKLSAIGRHTVTLRVGDGELSGEDKIYIFIRERPAIEGVQDSDEQSQILGLKSSEATSVLFIIALIVLIIMVFLAFVLTGVLKKKVSKKLKTEITPDQLKLPDEVQKLLAPQKAICEHCGSVISVVSKRRPLSVSCHECGKKSVIFHPGHSLLEVQRGPEHMEAPQELPQVQHPQLPPGQQ